MSTSAVLKTNNKIIQFCLKNRKTKIIAYFLITFSIYDTEIKNPKYMYYFNCTKSETERKGNTLKKEE